MTKGTSEHLRVSFPQRNSTSRQAGPILIGSLLLAAAVIVLRGQPRLVRGDWLLRTGHAWGVALGLLWALFLWPAEAGWLLAAIFLLAHLPWRFRHIQPDPRTALVLRDRGAADD